MRLKECEMWILGEGLNGVRRLVRTPPTSAAAMTGLISFQEHVPSPIRGKESRSGSETGRTGFSRKKAQETQKSGRPCRANLFAAKFVDRS